MWWFCLNYSGTIALYSIYSAMQIELLIMVSLWGSLVSLVFITSDCVMVACFSVLPSIGIGGLSAREAEGRTNIIAGEKVD